MTEPAPITPALLDSGNSTDPNALGWMQGTPPAADKRIRFADGSWYQFPQFRWSFSHVRELVPTVNIPRGSQAVWALPRAQRNDLDTLPFIPLLQTEAMTWAQSLVHNCTDGIVVLHRGQIVYERYAGALAEGGQHAAHSVTKSFVGTLGASLVAEGLLDPDAPVTQYVPELADSAFGTATVRQVMDMTTGLQYGEDYTDPKAEIWTFLHAGNIFARPADYAGPEGLQAFLQTVQPAGAHGQAFAYKTVNTDVLGWISQSVTGKPLAQNLSERYWRRMGMEQDAYLSIDGCGTAFAGGGLNTGLRDLARFGEMMRNDGRVDGPMGSEQIVPKAAVDDIQQGADRGHFAKAGIPTLAGWSYRNMWWVSHNAHGAFSARGVHGQAIYIDPAAEMVIARYGSYPHAANVYIDPTSLPAYHALAQHLMA